jgi:GR25 family glycosyltransferase involved in LPS biosynthesis
MPFLKDILYNNLINFNKKKIIEEDLLNKIKNNKSIIFLSKIKNIQLKIKNNFIIKIFIGESIKKYWSNFIDIILKKLGNYLIIDNYDINTDIVIYNEFDHLILNENNLNICINCENRDSDPLADIVILTIKKFIYNYNIYLPSFFLSLWERRDNYKKHINNSRENFCAYMYSYDLEYRVELFNFISKYKNVNALGKSCSNIKEDDRFVYNNDMTYNDIAVQKYSKYKFVLALENGISDGYITEKLINPIIANSIPIYAGPKDVFDIINPKRIIYVYNYSNYEELLNYIKEVDNDDDLYNSIISEEVFIGELNWNNFEDYLEEKIDKSLGFKTKNIYISDNNEIISYSKKIDLYIKDLHVYNLYDIKRYLNTFINKDDKILDKELNNKINFIDHIVWINLDRSKDRKSHIENLLKDLIINNTRISAIDGNRDDILSMINPIETDRTKSEIACTLSHIKAINYLKNMRGEYFLICEDDISFENITLIDSNLEKIIIESPDFDILLISKTYTNNLDQLYTNWNEEANQNNMIWSTVSYIISRKGIDNICNKVSYNNNIFNFNINYIHVADLFLYKLSKTYVYKYNFISTINKDSNIHENQLDYHIKNCEFQLNIIQQDFNNYILNKNNQIYKNNYLSSINLAETLDKESYLTKINFYVIN